MAADSLMVVKFLLASRCDAYSV